MHAFIHSTNINGASVLGKALCWDSAGATSLDKTNVVLLHLWFRMKKKMNSLISVKFK